MAGTSITQQLPLVELKGPVFESATLWQPGRSLQGESTATQSSSSDKNRPIRTRDLPQRESHLQPQQPVASGSNPTPRLLPLHYQQLHREASQITMATVAMERQRRRRDDMATAAASASIELDGRHLSAVGQRHKTATLPTTADVATTASLPSPPPPPTTLTTTAAVAAGASSGPSSLPFVQRHLRRHRTLLELTMGQDRLVVDAFAEAPSQSERLAAKMRACAGEPTRGQASILQRQQQQQQQAADKQQEQQQQHRNRKQQGQQRSRRLSRREKTAQTISRAMLTYDRSL